MVPLVSFNGRAQKLNGKVRRCIQRLPFELVYNLVSKFPFELYG